MKTKKIYIVLTHTGTFLSQIVKEYTKDEFSHISISLDRDLNEMYSFGRLTPYNPFWGGFVHEYVDKGTFKRFYNTRAKVYSLEISEDQYENIKNNIRQIQEKRSKYSFNILGLLAVGFHKKIERKYSFYCAEFVKYLIEEAKIDIHLPDIIKPNDFKEISELQEVYGGLLRKYKFERSNMKNSFNGYSL